MVDDRIAQGFKGKDCKCEGSENVTHHIATCISIAHCLTSSLNSIKSNLSFMRFNKIMSKSGPTIGSVTRNCHIQSILAFQKLAMLGPTFSLFLQWFFAGLKQKDFCRKYYFGWKHGLNGLNGLLPRFRQSDNFSDIYIHIYIYWVFIHYCLIFLK